MSSVSKRVELVRFRNKSYTQSHRPYADNTATVWKNVLDDVCDQCSLHGLNHIIRKDRSRGEKVFWAVTVACAVLLATYAIEESWKSYNKSSIDTVVETTFFNYADIAFPMVVVCDSSRVDWERVMRLTAKDIPGVDPSLLPDVRSMLKTFSVLSYGDFDEFDELRNLTGLSKLKHLNLTELLVKVMRPCSEVFCCGGCWWNFKKVNCCDVFELQRTEFGLCHSFNSDFSEYSRAMYVSTMTPNQLAPKINVNPSAVVMMSEPRGAPLGSDMVVMAGTFGNINVWGDRIYNTQRTKRLDPKKRNCFFADESPTGMGTNYYLRRNCKAACFMNYVMHHCGCYVEFMFGLMSRNDSLRPCNAEDLICLSDKNSFFNNFIPITQTPFFTKEPNTSGLKCNCMPDCLHQMYISELTIAEPTIRSVLNSSSSILIDLHFRQSTCILYRSDLVLGWLDLLVSFGGCAGLFLGASLLSFIELIYFLTWRVYYHWSRTRSKSKKKIDVNLETWTMNLNSRNVERQTSTSDI